MLFPNNTNALIRQEFLVLVKCSLYAWHGTRLYVHHLFDLCNSVSATVTDYSFSGEKSEVRLKCF